MLANKHAKSYVCIDLKSFYASVECVDRGLDPFTENLVVADPDRGSGTICLAITPAMKALGVKNRCRIFQIPNGIEYTMATPRMARYMEVSAQINALYLRYVSAEDIHVYSIDECFIDATPYLKLYRMGAKAFAEMLRNKVAEETGITATAGIGPNLFLAKVALDIEAKKAADGIGILDEESYKREIWFHRPITDIWQVGPGIAHRLAKHGIHDMAGVCAANPAWLKKEFGKNGDYLLDHAWGQEPCTIKQIKEYRPAAHSISNGQVLMRDYSFSEARTVLREMADASCLDLCSKGLSCGNVSVHVGYAQPHLTESGRWGMGSGGSTKLSERTDSPHRIVKVARPPTHQVRPTQSFRARGQRQRSRPGQSVRCRARPLWQERIAARHQLEAGRNHARTQQPNRRPPCLAKAISWKTLPSTRRKGAAAYCATLQCSLGKTASTSPPTAPNAPPSSCPSRR